MEEIDASKMLCYQFQIIIGIASCLKLLLCQGMFTVLYNVANMKNILIK